MSFSSSVKDEAVKLRIKSNDEKLALIGALTHTAGSMAFGRGISLVYVTENYNVAKLIAQIACSLYDVNSAVSVTEHERLNARSVVVRLSGNGCRSILVDSGCLPENEDDNIEFGHIPDKLILNDDMRKMFLRGAFLGAGSISDPKKGYHLEFVCKHELFANELCTLVNSYDLNARVSERKTSFVTYIKEGEKVSDFLTLIGAMNGTMQFEHTRIVRGLSNDLNRQRNFEDANMQKTAKSAAQQLIDIEYIISEKGFDFLPEKLRVVAEIRINNPESSLSEIAQMADSSKSGVNHRLKKLSEIAQTLRIENGLQI